MKNLTYSKSNMDNLLLTFKSNINIDNGVTNISQGEFESTMELHLDILGFPELIEWDNEVEVTHIGLIYNDGKLIDYDGVFELPKEAILLIRKAGFVVPNEFENN